MTYRKKAERKRSGWARHPTSWSGRVASRSRETIAVRACSGPIRSERRP